jgi:hypothetical protein
MIPPRPGLSPGKKRQASLGALSSRLSRLLDSWRCTFDQIARRPPSCAPGSWPFRPGAGAAAQRLFGRGWRAPPRQRSRRQRSWSQPEGLHASLLDIRGSQVGRVLAALRIPGVRRWVPRLGAGWLGAHCCWSFRDCTSILVASRSNPRPRTLPPSATGAEGDGTVPAGFERRMAPVAYESIGRCPA